MALLDRPAVSKMCHCLSALGQAVPMEDRLTTRTACPKADKQDKAGGRHLGNSELAG